MMLTAEAITAVHPPVMALLTELCFAVRAAGLKGEGKIQISAGETRCAAPQMHHQGAQPP